MNTVTSKIDTDFTIDRSGERNYGYDFKTLDYFDVRPSFHNHVVHETHPVLKPVDTSTVINFAATPMVSVSTANDTAETVKALEDRTNCNEELSSVPTDMFNILNNEHDGNYKNIKFNFTKTKRTYNTLYLNINDILDLCDNCFAFNCVCDLL